MCFVCLQCPWRSKESNRFPKIRVADGYYYGEGARNQTWSSARATELSLALWKLKFTVCELEVFEQP